MRVETGTLPLPSGDEVRELRVAQGLGVSELARRVGVSRSSIWRAEADRGASAHLRRLLGILLTEERR
ncbi:MAG: helix-turn-helix domain-containing protein [Actinobacteria bacterium]|nr:helix-turn-helix domain-containing protein [Actinomycetota bacterium]